MWLGPDKIPEEFQLNIDLLKNNNPTYTHYFWDNKKALEEFPEIEIFFRLECVPTFISNWLRLRVLEKYGGWYIDVDYTPHISLGLDKLIEELKIQDTDIILIEANLHNFQVNNGFYYCNKLNFNNHLNYLPDAPIMRVFNDYIEATTYSMFIIKAKYIGMNGIYFKEKRMRSFYAHKHFKFRLVKDKDNTFKLVQI